MNTEKSNKLITEYLILPVVVTGLILRCIGIRFGLPQAFHPDEPHIIMATKHFFTGDLNPHNFLYPSLLMYVTHAVQRLYYLIAASPIDLSVLYVIGRAVTACLGAATLALIYLLARRLSVPIAGFIAATLLCFSVLHLVNSHYATTDVPLAFLVLATIYYSLKLTEESEPRTYLIAGLLAGLTVSMKIPGIFVFMPILVAHSSYMKKKRRLSFTQMIREPFLRSKTILFRSLTAGAAATAVYLLLRNSDAMIGWIVAKLNVEIVQRFQEPITVYLSGGAWKYGIVAFIAAFIFLALLPVVLIDTRKLLVLAGSAVIAFLVTTPYAVLDYRAFLHDFFFQIVISKTTWAGRFADGQSGYLVQVGYLIKDFPFPIALFALAGLIKAIRSRRIEHWMIISFVLSYLLYIGSWSIKFDRYVLPVLPFYALWAGMGFQYLVEWSVKAIRSRHEKLVPAFQGLVWILSFFILSSLVRNAYSFEKYLLKPNTKSLAYDWAVNELPKDAKILREQYAPELELAGFSVMNLNYAFNDSVDAEYVRSRGYQYVMVTDKLWKRPIRNNGVNVPREAYAKIPQYADLVYSIKPTREHPGPEIRIYKVRPDSSLAQ